MPHRQLKENYSCLVLTPSYFLPTTACLIQDKLGLSTNCGALDFNLGCSGYIYGLALAKGLICANIAKNILLITAETYSKHIHQMNLTFHFQNNFDLFRNQIQA